LGTFKVKFLLFYIFWSGESRNIVYGGRTSSIDSRRPKLIKSNINAGVQVPKWVWEEMGWDGNGTHPVAARNAIPFGKALSQKDSGLMDWVVTGDMRRRFKTAPGS